MSLALSLDVMCSNMMDMLLYHVLSAQLLVVLVSFSLEVAVVVPH